MKVVVIDDDPGIAEVISLCFELRWPSAEVSCAPDGQSGLVLIRSEEPDVVILDVGLPDIDGFDVCRRIRRFSQVPVIMLTVRDQRSDMARGLEGGADDYITKPFSHIDLLSRVQAVLRRSQRKLRFPAEHLHAGDLLIDLADRKVWLRGKPVELNDIEYQLLFHLIDNFGQTVSYNALLKETRGLSCIGGENVELLLNRRIHRLRQKLEDDLEAPKIIVSEPRGGFRFTLYSAQAVAERSEA